MSENLNIINSKDKNFYLRILKNEPNNYDAILKLGLIEVKESDFNSAKEKFKKLIKININKFEGHLNLSNIYILEKKVTKANNILNNYLDEINENIEIINALSINLLNSKDYQKLERLIDNYIYKYESYILYYLKGYILKKNDKISKSEIYFKKSITINPNFWQSYESLFKQYEKQSKLKNFKELLSDAKIIFNENPMLAYYEALYFFRDKNYKKSLTILKDRQNEISLFSKQNETFLLDCYHLFSRVYERLGFFNSSYNFAIKRNKIALNLKENKKFNKKLILDTIAVYKTFFEKKNKPKVLNLCNGIEHSNLVFLIGFPRSGTTLLDTILRANSKTLVLEEKPYLLDVRHEFYQHHKLNDILNIDENKKIRMQKQYFNSFDYKSDKIIIDKYPLNLIELGFIKTIFPNSKIILALRHPLDCIISCVLTSFKMNDGMIHFENVHTASYFYNECFDLLMKYFNYYQISYHTVKYENVINNFKNEISNLIKYLNLTFEESMYNFQRTAKEREKINTPSYDQVVQPIYSSSINRYKNFDEIKNIKNDMQKWIEEFSY